MGDTDALNVLLVRNSIVDIADREINKGVARINMQLSHKFLRRMHNKFSRYTCQITVIIMYLLVYSSHEGYKEK